MVGFDSTKNPHSKWEWLGIGTVMILCGIAALATPFVTSIGLAFLLGAILLIAGLVQLVHAIRYHKQAGNVGRYILASLAIISGLLTLRNPIGGMMGITLSLSFFLLVGAVGKVAVATDLHPARGATWIFASAFASFMLGLFLLITFPVNSFIVPGIFFGVDLVLFGSALIAYAFFPMKRVAATENTSAEYKKAA